MQTFTKILICLFFFSNLSAQQNPMTLEKGKRNTEFTTPDLDAISIDGRDAAPTPSAFPSLTLPQLSTKNTAKPVHVLRAKDTGIPIFIKTDVGTKSLGLRTPQQIEAASFEYLKELKQTLLLKTPENEFVVKKVETDKLNQTHIRLQQYYKGVEVFGGEILLHAPADKIVSLNGRYYPTPILKTVTPTLSQKSAFQAALQDVSKDSHFQQLSDEDKQFLQYKEDNATLIIYHKDLKLDSEQLAYHVTIRPNFLERWEYFIDAHTGKVIFKYDHTCTFGHLSGQPAHAKGMTLGNEPFPKIPITATKADRVMDGPATATAQDLFGTNRTINVYDVGGTYYFIDAARTMFDATNSTMPDDSRGTIWTIDAQNTSPQNNLSVAHVTSSNNSWNAPTAVSAHYNAGESYTYFKNAHGRNSINGTGGRIVSIINVSDQNGNSMDNAFWNGAAIFYGNGGGAFQPLAKSLDVAGHEMSHGVVTNSANLQYQGQSGALNESFADIFGVMIDRNDWKLGDDVANTSTFPTGALRDMADPHNGGSQFTDPGYQPRHMNEIYTGSQDNGGVHINSGIVNWAFYKYASAIGKDDAEDVYYRALTVYLTANSQFIDARIAVIQSATDLFGASSTQVTEAENAFDAVGITAPTGGGGGGTGGGTPAPGDLVVNSGPDFILSHNTDIFDPNSLYISDTQGANFTAISSTATIRPPSIQDDGSYAVYIGTDNRMYGIPLDGVSSESLLNLSPAWANIAISKDGNRIAAISNNQDTSIWVYDFNLAQWARFQLYNPTFTQGVSSGDVVVADAIEWDYSGKFLIYDALNKINTLSGTPIEYWDVGMIEVWDTTNNNFGNGQITKLFSNLPQDVSIGNPSFSKNSPHIAAFDYIDNGANQLFLIAVNLITGTAGTVFQNNKLSYPNYSKLDDKIIFDGENFFGDDVIASIDLNADKLTPSGQASVLIDDAKWGKWFAQGTRPLTTDTEELPLIDGVDVLVYPNPVVDDLAIEIHNLEGEKATIELMNLLGQTIQTHSFTINAPAYKTAIDMDGLASNIYLVNVRVGGQVMTKKVVKMEK